MVQISDTVMVPAVPWYKYLGTMVKAYSSSDGRVSLSAAVEAARAAASLL